MENIRTNYEKWYASDDYYWGTEAAGFCDGLIKLRPAATATRVLDIGCGEGFEKINKITNLNGIVFFNVFVEKPFLELPPDWDIEEKMWKSGELFTYFPDWKIHHIEESIIEDNSGG